VSLYVAKTSREHCRAHEEHDRQRDLSGDKQAAEWCTLSAMAKSPARDRPRTGTQCGRVVYARRPERGHQAKQCNSNERHKERERQHAHINRQVEGNRRPIGCECEEGAASPPREEQPGGRAKRREHEALGEELADETAAVGAECQANGHFLASRNGSRQQQVGDIRADDAE
jgi:hypothetical protein